MPAEIRKLNHSPLPVSAFLDTSFLYRHSVPPDSSSKAFARYQREQAACQRFAVSLQVGHTPLWVSDWVYEEFVYSYSSIGLRRLARERVVYWKELKEHDPTVIGPLVADAEAVFETIQRRLEFRFLDASAEAQKRVRSSVKEISVRFNLLSRDAFHVATCQEHRLNSIVSADRDFERADGVILYTCNEDAVGQDV